MKGDSCYASDYILRELIYFKVKKQEESDLEIIFTDKIELPDSYICLLKDLYYKNGCVYVMFADGMLSVSIKDLPSKHIKIISEKKTSPEIVFSVVEKIMSLKLLEKNFCLLHAASCNEHGQTILFSSLPGTGKTSWILDKCSNGAFFLSDDLVIVDRNGNIFAYPRAFTLGKQHKDFFNIYISKNKYFQCKYKLLKFCLYIFSLLALPFPGFKKRVQKYSISKDYFRIQIKDIIPDVNIVRKSQVDKIVLAFNAKGDLEGGVWGTKRIVNFLINNTNRELIKFIYLHFFAFLAYGDECSIQIKNYLKKVLFKQKRIVYSLTNNSRIEILKI